MLTPEKIASPCKNFCFLSAAPFCDPRDGREKVACVTFANYAGGALLLVDPAADTAESYHLPQDEGAWALYNDRDRALILGTCSRFGCVHRFDLASRSFSEPVRTETETYIWNFADGHDGCLYGGTYPGCRLVRYDLDGHTLTDLGRVSPNEKNLYSRTAAYYDGHILVTVGMDRASRWAYRLSDGKFFEDDGTMGFPPQEKLLAFEDPRLGEGMSCPCALGRGGLFAVWGQEYVYWADADAAPVIRRFPCDAPSTSIMTLAADERGVLWGACTFGMTIFSYDPATGRAWNSPALTATGGGEAYAIVFAGGKLYTTAYAGGWHIEYDPEKPWDQRAGENPRVLGVCAPAYIRPEAGSVLGPDKCVWTGWLAAYGTYGGAISRVRPETGEVTVYPVGDRGVGAIAAGSRAVFYATSGAGNGLPTLPGPFSLCAVDGEGAELCRTALDTATRSLAVSDGTVFCALPDRVALFDEATLAQEGSIPVSGCTKLLVSRKHGVLAFTESGTVYALSAAEKRAEPAGSAPAGVRAVCEAADGIYCAKTVELWRLDER
ncbi:MAG: hypothetical protein PUD44_06170 [Clostridiaceae bacterium]|nr:hypothetical protein [Clostridiaceae bacterium]